MSEPARPWPLSMLMVAGLYVGTGLLGLLLAIPPGYATAIFPPAGIALAAVLIGGWRMLPGIWLGSALMNAWVAWPVLSGASLAIAATIGVGAAAQAAAGRALLAAAGCLPLRLDEELGVLRFVVLGAMVSTLIGASIGVGTLYSAGAISRSEIANSWLTWWIGDGIGVLLVAPVAMMLAAAPRAYWRPQLRTVAPLLAIAFTLVIVLFVRARQWEDERLEVRFREHARETAERVRSAFEDGMVALHHVERYFAASSLIEREEYRRFVTYALSTQPEVNAIAWVPAVAADQLPVHEAAMRARGIVDYQVWQHDPQRGRVAPAPRDWYFPAAYVEPAAMHEALTGFDLGADPVRRATFERAQRRLALTFSPPLRTVTGIEVLAALPIQTADVALRPAEWVAGVLRIPMMIDQALIDTDLSDLSLRLEDLDAADGWRVLYDNGVASAEEARRHYALDWQPGGRRWRISIEASPAYLAHHHSWQAWFVLAGGMLFTGLLGALLMLGAGHTVRVERQVAARTRELQHSESTLRAVSESALDGILLLDPDGAIRACNPAGAELLGTTPHAAIGRRLQDWLAPGSRLPLDRLELQLHGVRHELELRRGDRLFPAELTLTCLRVDDDRIFSCLLRDLSERYEVDRLKSEFIATVSHELRTPLTSIRGTLSLLDAGALGELPPQVAQLIEVAGRNAERLARQINDLLDFERLQFDRMPLVLVPQRLLPLLQQAIAEIHHYAAGKRIALRFEPAAGADVEVQIAADRFVQVINNLLSNAIKFSPDGADVIVRTLRLTQAVRIEVEDRGPGIPTELHAYVFDRFWQADASTGRKHGGSGLGLAIARTLVERMGGTIGFRSAPGEGSCFFVELPVAESAAGT